jgi:predicted nicotinamide N-methyase
MQETKFDIFGQTVDIKEHIANTQQTGTKIWTSSIIFSRFLEDNRKKFNLKQKRVVELGSGCGLAGIACALQGAQVTFTDIPEMIYLLEQNVRNNLSSEHNPLVKAHTWGDDVSSLSPPFDYVVGTDVLFKIQMVEPLIKSLLNLSSKSTVIIIAHEPRDPLVIEEFYKMAQEYFTVSKAKKPKPRNDEEKDMLNFVEIYTLKKKLS